jgi:predicted ribosome quality control (RQC) complex YloA/Tae2 family protein
MESFHQHRQLVLHLASALKKHLNGFIITDAFKINRYSCAVNFSNGKDFFAIKISIAHQSFFIESFKNEVPRSESVYPLFKDVLQQHVEVLICNTDRVFAFSFNNNMQLVFKLFGPLSNILLICKNKVVSLFRPEIISDLNFDITKYELVTPKLPANTNFYVGLAQNKYVFLFEPTAHVDIKYKTADVLDALNFFTRKFLSHTHFAETHKKLVQQYVARQKKLLADINKLQNAINAMAKQTPPEEIGHIIMANLHALHKGQTSAELFNFYNQTNITIKLKKNLQPQENATYYYKKAKSLKGQLAKLTMRLDELKSNLETVQNALAVIATATTIKALKPFIKEKTLAQKNNLPYKTYSYNNFAIWVGKSAANNDLLTLKHTHKNDLWLHAKDVSGSHVVIKQKGNGVFPKDVIEYAARIAAFYSKAKHSNLVPVIYTPKKYVRKPKGYLPGQVAVDKEEIIMVEPNIELD